MDWKGFIFNTVLSAGFLWVVCDIIISGKVPFYEGKKFNCVLVKSTPTDSFRGARGYRKYVREYNCPSGYKIFVEWTMNLYLVYITATAFAAYRLLNSALASIGIWRRTGNGRQNVDCDAVRLCRLLASRICSRCLFLLPIRSCCQALDTTKSTGASRRTKCNTQHKASDPIWGGAKRLTEASNTPGGSSSFPGLFFV